MNVYKRIFLDTSPLIYFLDENSMFKPNMDKIFYEILNQGSTLITSTITVEEFLVYPYRKEDFTAIQGFHNFIKDKKISVLKIDVNIAVEAAKIRAEYQHFKSMDALQLAAAICSGCDLFLTNDKQLKQFDKISCMTVAEWS